MTLVNTSAVVTCCTLGRVQERGDCLRVEATPLLPVLELAKLAKSVGRSAQNAAA